MDILSDCLRQLFLVQTIHSICRYSSQFLEWNSWSKMPPLPLSTLRHKQTCPWMCSRWKVCLGPCDKWGQMTWSWTQNYTIFFMQLWHLEQNLHVWMDHAEAFRVLIWPACRPYFLKNLKHLMHYETRILAKKIQDCWIATILHLSGWDSIPLKILQQLISMFTDCS